ncbi:NAD-dependent epimerase/dehydratase family protein [Proteiniphilum saccharofermentans]|uniref:NAD-dependent epimerase/dehydratase family protein n=1 Tax=Proteiniphilum saccharofermentans TaxID=1642647 RepID=UPI0028A75283|nr:NAD-dependent epimerase/dehydratase family protein [Proteiniphilum saccharofermentans]
MKTILITGINGFVGTNFTKNWNMYHYLFGLDIHQPTKEGVNRIFSWDEMGKIPPVDAIVHLAGKAHDTKNQSEAQSYFDINTGLTQRIFDYFLQSDAQTFIFFSSVKAAADTVPGDILTEEIIPHPVGPYGESKIKAEEYILRIKRQESRDKTKKIYILRPCMIHGPGNKGNLNLLYNVVKKGIPWPLGAYENLRSFCSVDNISYVVEQLIIRDNIESGIYHIGDDEPLSTNELIGMISESVKKKAHIWKLPKSLINPMASVGEMLHLTLNKQRLQKLTENYVVSNEKIKNALGITKMPISARDGMRKTLESFR